ncbi:MAG TPA: META domain-containing protein [Flavobacteriia bacterium]|nr:META domain-containing protein [Flavobacteriia bacterium]
MENKKIGGFAGCNRYDVDYTLKDDFLKLGNPLATKMYCANMNIEKKFFENLAKVKHIKIENQKLFFLDASNTVLIEAIPENKEK